MRCSNVVFVFYVLFVLWVPSSQTAAAPRKIAAKVNGEPIFDTEVEREISIAYRDRPIADAAKDLLRAKTLEQLIKRRLVLLWLAETKQSATTDEIARALQQLQQGLTDRGRTLADYLAEQQLDEDGLKRLLAWQIGWQRYLDKQLTDKNLERYFEKHRREFDGTSIRVAHILFKLDGSADAPTLHSVRERAGQLAREIRAAKISFGDAARQHSDSPSREVGGDIGWIQRREPMPELFSRAAFELEMLQISEPVRTPFGFHLIQCLQIKPGDKHWTDVRAELEQAVTLYLFDWSAEQVRGNAEIKFSSDYPHLAPGTDSLDSTSK